MRKYAVSARMTLLAVGLTLPATARANDTLRTSEGPDPVPLLGAAPVPTCGWPSVVGVQASGSSCTGALVHPEIVMYAAHCLGGNGTISFGERLQDPSGQTVSATCKTNPGFSNPQTDVAKDYAYCRLSSPVTNVPTIPVALGCEVEERKVGDAVAMVGYGWTDRDPAVGNRNIKHWGMTSISQLQNGMVRTPGNDSTSGTSGCPGDSGGPLLRQYSDGAWRVVGITSAVAGNQCGGDVVYAPAENAVAWIEQDSGIDITPCHDPDGTWNPNPGCAGFFAGDENGSGAWSAWCSGTPAIEKSATCGPPEGTPNDGMGPDVTIVSPMHLDEYARGEFPGIVDIEASDPTGVQKMLLEIDGERLPQEDTAAPWQFTGVNFPPGTYTIVAIGVDYFGNEGRSNAVTIGVDETPVDPTGDPYDPTSASSGGTAATGGTDGGQDGGGGCGCRNGQENGAPLAALGVLVLLSVRRRRGL